MAHKVSHIDSKVKTHCCITVAKRNDRKYAMNKAPKSGYPQNFIKKMLIQRMIRYKINSRDQQIISSTQHEKHVPDHQRIIKTTRNKCSPSAIKVVVNSFM